MSYVVMTSEENTALTAAVQAHIKTTKYKTWPGFVEQTKEDFRPKEIKGDLWILPLSLRDNPKFSKVKQWIIANDITIREVQQNEFIDG